MECSSIGTTDERDAMKTALRFIPLVILAAAIAMAYIFDLHTALSLEGIQAQKEQFKEYINAHPLLAPLLFIGIYTISVALSLPIATLLTLLGGFLFGLSIVPVCCS